MCPWPWRRRPTDSNKVRTQYFRHHLQGIDLNTSDYDGRTALHVAAAEGQLECVKFLLESAEVNPNPRDRWEFSPLGEAKRFDHSEVADYLEKYLGNHGIQSADD